MITFPVKFGGYKTIYASDMPSFQRDFAGEKTLNHGTGPDITFTRASSATFFDSAGVLQTAGNNVPRFDHDPTRVNLLLHSEAFNTGWGKVRSSISSDTEIAPDGTLTADTFIEDTTANNTHHMAQGVASVSAAQTLTGSVYAKAKERTRLRVVIWDDATGSNNVFSTFNLSNGTFTVGNSGTGTGATAQIINVGNGWYRCVITGQPHTSGNPALALMLDNGSTLSYTGDGTSGLYIWGAQLQIGSTATTYLPTTTSVAAESRGLLIEESRTNSLRNSTMQGAVAGTPGTLPTNWSAFDPGSISREVVGAGTASGLNYIDIRFHGTNTSGSLVQPIVNLEGLTVIVAALTQSWTLSAYCSLVSGSLTNVSSPTLRVIERNVGGTYLADTSVILTPLLSTPTRFAASRVFTQATVERAHAQFLCSINDGASVDFTIRIAAPQLEQGAFATSYIPTTNAAVTRSADSAVVTPISSFYNQAEGTFTANWTVPASQNNQTVFAGNALSGGGSTAIFFFNESSNANGFVENVRTSGPTGSFATRSKVALAFSRGGGASMAVDGTGYTSAAEQTSTIVSITVGHLATATRFLNGHIRKIAYWPKRLSNAHLQKLTT